MEQLVAHLLGDYFLQSHKVSQLKTQQIRWTLLHVVLYTLPFLFITQNPIVLLAIAVPHLLIDRYRLANYVAKIKNWEWSTPNGYPEDTPPYLWVWLMIITDNTLHIITNYLAIKYL